MGVVRDFLNTTVYDGADQASPPGGGAWPRIDNDLAWDETAAGTLPHASMLHDDYLRLTLEHVGVGIAHTGLDGRCLLVNSCLCDIVGFSREGLLSRRFQGVSERNDAGSGPAYERRLLDLNQVYARRLLNGEASSYTVRKHYLRREQGPVTVHVTVSLIRAPSGQPERFIWVVEDVTVRVQAEAAMREIQDGERRRIARGLHDVVMQDLVYALQTAQVAEQRTDDVALRDDLQQQIDSLQRAVQGMRDVIYDLHYQDGGAHSLIDLLEKLVGTARRVSPRHEIELVIQDNPFLALPMVAAVELSHIVREALTNARRHAGARSIAVSIGVDEGAVWVEVTDDGRGFDAELAAGGIGLDAMRERARAIGAALTVESEPGQGTRVRVRAPVEGPLRIVPGMPSMPVARQRVAPLPPHLIELGGNTASGQ